MSELPAWLAAARWVARGAGVALAALVFRVGRVRRGHVEAALARASLPAASADAWRVYRSLGASLGEWLLARALSPRRVDELVSWTPRASRLLAEARARGPVVVCATHTGNWELSLASLGRRAPTVALVRRISSPLVRVFARSARARFGVDAREGRDGRADVAREARSGRVLVSVLDQRPETARSRHVAELLGAPAALDAAPFVLGARAGATVLLAVASRGPRGEVRVDVLDAYLAPARGRARWVRESLGSAAKALDRFVRQHPSEWLWLHRLWPERAPSSGERGAPPCPGVLLPLGDAHGR